MERFFGFDLGDAESAVSVLRKKDTGNLYRLPVFLMQNPRTAVH